MFRQVDASDHDDGETNIKSRNLSLTDLYVFREDWQTGNAADNDNLILVMNTNPRSLPRQPYYFNPNALYNFSVSVVNNVNDAVNGREDLRFELAFGQPNAQGQQTINLNVHQVANGVPISTTTGVPAGGTALTTPARPLLNGVTPPVLNTFAVSGTNIDVFAGLREDPFFFDVEAFFKVRATLGPRTDSITPTTSPTLTNFGLNPGGFAGSAATSVDFAQGYNVNAIVVRVPIAFLRPLGGAQTTFDFWETITLPSNIAQFQ
ncbi:MAG: DUF4331 family protein [Armatimonadetes bacterium]|nr:DUF4331 family protein [Armatimonadota bacterium]